ncbi:tRNA dihydrouridine synthase [Saitoella coloradoensis]
MNGPKPGEWESGRRIEASDFKDFDTSEFHPTKFMTGRRFFEHLGKPRRIVAPMVDMSELAWRVLSRRHGADLCYTPMFHARLFAEPPEAHAEKYRNGVWSTLPEGEGPLIVQFCANNPEELLRAAKLVVGKCDAVDINFGCPQGIAKKGKYGAFLMEEWELVYSLINILHTRLAIPVTAKIRIFDDPAKTLAYAKMVLSAGATFLGVHGRTRDQKGILTGVADWTQIKMLRDNLPPDTVIFANGNILHPADILRCLEATGADAVMSAEGNLYNPAIFHDPSEPIDVTHPRVDLMAREYIKIVAELNDKSSWSSIKGHLFKLLRPAFLIHTEPRNTLGKTRGNSIEELNAIVDAVTVEIDKAIAAGDGTDLTGIELDEHGFVKLPWWRCQPCLRPEAPEGAGKKQKKKKAEMSEQKAKFAGVTATLAVDAKLAEKKEEAVANGNVEKAREIPTSAEELEVAVNGNKRTGSPSLETPEGVKVQRVET